MFMGGGGVQYQNKYKYEHNTGGSRSCVRSRNGFNHNSRGVTFGVTLRKMHDGRELSFFGQGFRKLKVDTMNCLNKLF